MQKSKKTNRGRDDWRTHPSAKDREFRPANPDDWDVLIIEIFPNMASYDTFWKDWAEVDAEIVADRAQEQEGTTRINAVRTMLGVQIGREVHLKSPDQRAE
jgi:hypothetical protein